MKKLNLLGSIAVVIICIWALFGSTGSNTKESKFSVNDTFPGESIFTIYASDTYPLGFDGKHPFLEEVMHNSQDPFFGKILYRGPFSELIKDDDGNLVIGVEIDRCKDVQYIFSTGTLSELVTEENPRGETGKSYVVEMTRDPSCDVIVNLSSLKGVLGTLAFLFVFGSFLVIMTVVVLGRFEFKKKTL